MCESAKYFTSCYMFMLEECFCSCTFALNLANYAKQSSKNVSCKNVKRLCRILCIEEGSCRQTILNRWNAELTYHVNNNTNEWKQNSFFDAQKNYIFCCLALFLWCPLRGQHTSPCVHTECSLHTLVSLLIFTQML